MGWKGGKWEELHWLAKWHNNSKAVQNLQNWRNIATKRYHFFSSSNPVNVGEGLEKVGRSGAEMFWLLFNVTPCISTETDSCYWRLVWLYLLQNGNIGISWQVLRIFNVPMGKQIWFPEYSSALVHNLNTYPTISKILCILNFPY